MNQPINVKRIIILCLRAHKKSAFWNQRSLPLNYLAPLPLPCQPQPYTVSRPMASILYGSFPGNCLNLLNWVGRLCSLTETALAEEGRKPGPCRIGFMRLSVAFFCPSVSNKKSLIIQIKATLLTIRDSNKRN